MGDTVGLIVMIGLPAVAIVGFAYSFLKNRSLKGMMFNATVERTVGEVRFRRGVIKVHSLRKDDNRFVGLECAQTHLGGYDMQPHTLTREEAQELIAVLQSAVSSS